MTKTNELTRDMILAMDEIDLSAAVTEHIMGESLEIPHGYKGVEVVWPDGRETIMPKPYASNISEAWGVLEKFKTHQVTYSETGFSHSDQKYRVIVGKNQNVAYSDSAPEAISKAALLSVINA